jgi:plastocyanin/FtsP/CotA-like multicopper oxidase with cupredoxin domain
MATLDVWLQLEAQPWDVCPKRPTDRSTAEGVLPVASLQHAFLRSPVTGRTRTAIVNVPMPGGALLLRRYSEGWRAPDDRKVNPWDLNEPDPTDAGTMGTIPGALIECDVGDIVRVHFRNMDFRAKNPPAPWEHPASVESLPVECRTHSLHAHGFVYAREHDGAYPLTPPDPTQPVDANEIVNWNFVGVKRFKQGDRVPPGGTFVYTWEARAATSAGTWFYHDHSICSHDNTARGAIGLIVIHNPDDAENEVEITPERLPGGSWLGTPLTEACYPVGLVPILPYALALLGGDVQAASDAGAAHARTPAQVANGAAYAGDTARGAGEAGPVRTLSGDRVIRWGGIAVELDDTYTAMKRICIDVYRDPPDQALCLLLFHEMPGVGMCINGRKYLGNTPTLLAGPGTRLRFGVLGTGDAFHTFHIHGHRWVVPGPAGTTRAAIEQSAQVQATSPFEDTKVFGPASSFTFTIDAAPSPMRPDPPVGEWHMHCHVDHHMMEGMVGSLLIVNGGEVAFPLPVGRGCPPPMQEPAPVPEVPARVHDVQITAGQFQPNWIYVGPGDKVRWTNTDQRSSHSVEAHDNSWGSNNLAPGQTYVHTFSKLGVHPYRCLVHASHGKTHTGNEQNRGTVEVKVGAGSGTSPSSPAAGPTTHQVQISSTGFSPGSITIKAGDSVNWTNQDSSAHSATADDHSWATPTLTTGKAFSRTFTTPGAIPYHCHIHHEMTAKIQVNP